jgi:hypothetical protein
MLLLFELDHMRNLVFLVSHQKYNLAPAHTDGVTVGQLFATHGYAINKSTVMTIEINQLEAVAVCIDGEMPARYGAIAEAEIIGGISTHGQPILR